MKSLAEGAKIGKLEISLLLFADDIVLLAETSKGLQRMLEEVGEYSKNWRFRLNC